MENKTKFYSAIALTTLAFLVVGATYAYFQNQYDSASNADVKVMTYTTDVLTFETGDAINITADQETFGKDKGNRTGSSFAKAILQANSKTKLASMKYNLYLLIEDNEFSYTLNNENPELILNITDSNGTIITINNLTQKTVTDAKGNNITGYDITSSSGLITLLDNKTIEVISSDNGKKEENWNVTLTLINYAFDQNNNAGKSFNAKLIIQKEVYPTVVGDVCNNGNNLAGCVATLSNKGGSLVTKVYHHDGTIKDSEGNILDAEDGSYRYAGFEYNDIYSCKYNGIDIKNSYGGLYFGNKELCNVIYRYISETNVNYSANDANFKVFEDETPINWDLTNSKCVTENGDDIYFYGSSKKLTQEYCTGNAMLHTGLKKYYPLMKIGSGISTFQEAKTSINNYVCFGSDEEICPDDNLYRIIGVFDGKIKLIKADIATSTLLGTDGDYNGIYNAKTAYYRGNLSSDSLPAYYFNYNGLEDKTVNNGSGSRDWSTSLLNKVNLNTNFLNNIDQKWSNIIVPSTWYYGSYKNISAKINYQSEIQLDTYQAKVGISSFSDYNYSFNHKYWKESPNSYPEYPFNSWFQIGVFEYTTIGTPSRFMFSISPSSGIGMVSAGGTTFGTPIRPVFYLETSVAYASGTGTSTDPIRLKI